MVQCHVVLFPIHTTAHPTTHTLLDHSNPFSMRQTSLLILGLRLQHWNKNSIISLFFPPPPFFLLFI